MIKPSRLTIVLALAGCAAVLFMALRMDAPPSPAAGQRRPPVLMASPVPLPLAAKTKPQPLHPDEDSLLPALVLPAPAAAELADRAVANMQILGFKGRPPGELMMSSWAARDPEGAGRWLNQNRDLRRPRQSMAFPPKEVSVKKAKIQLERY